MTDGSTTDSPIEFLPLLQTAIPQCFAPGLVKLCRPRVPHTHGGLACKTPGKRPVTKAFTKEALARYRAAQADTFDAWALAREAASWLAAGYNVGLVPPPGVVVFDCDTAPTVAWVRAMLSVGEGTFPCQTRTAAKAHFWARYDPDTLPLRATQLRFLLPDGSPGVLDLRVGGRSQVVVAPSLHAESASAPSEGYTWRTPLPHALEGADGLPDLPRGLAEALFRLIGGDATSAAARRVRADEPADADGEAPGSGTLRLASSPGTASDIPGHDRLRGYINRLCRYASGSDAREAQRGIRERAQAFAAELYLSPGRAGGDGAARLAALVAEGGELDRLIASGWALFGAAAPMAEDKTDQGYLDLFTSTHGSGWRWVIQRRGWIEWDEAAGYWVEGHDESLGRRIGRMADVLFDDAAREPGVERRARLMGLSRQLRNNARVDSILARARKSFAVDELMLDSQGLEVVFPGMRAGGVWHPARVLSLADGELREPVPEDLVTRAMGAPWIPETGEEGEGAWTAFIRSTIPDLETRQYLQRAVGMSLAGVVLEHVFLFLHGPGGTGKSTLLNALADAFGGLAVRCDVRTFAEDSRRSASAATPDVARLKGARLAVCSEIPDRARLGARMKDLTGGDRIVGRHNYGKPVEFPPSHTVWVAGNCEPQADWMDTGVWRRLRQVPLDAQHARADAGLPLRLGAPLARAAIAQWAVAGWHAYQAAGGLGTCSRVEAATAAFRARLDPMADWLEEGARIGVGTVKSADAYAHYCAFMEGRGMGRGKVSAIAFGRYLAERGVATRKGHGGVRMLHGISLVEGGKIGLSRSLPNM